MKFDTRFVRKLDLPRAFLNFILLLSMLLGLAAVGRTPARAQDDDLIVVIDEVLVDQYEDDGTLQAYVTVRHPQVGAVEDLSVEDFTLNISGGAPFVPEEAELKDDAPVSLAVVLELYQTMAGEPLKDAKAAISHLCTTKPPQDRVAIFAVRHDVDPDSRTLDEDYERNFTEDGGLVDNFTQGLETVSGRGGTPLYDTMVRAMRFTAEVSKEPVGRRAVVVITDGGDVGSRYNDQTVIEVAQNLKVPVYTIGYTGRNRQYDQSLNEIANRTGGSYRNTPETDDFKMFLDDIRTEMSKHYLLTFKAEGLESGRQILEVRVDSAGLSSSDSSVFDVDVTAATATPEPDATATSAPTSEAGGTVEATAVPAEPTPAPSGEFDLREWLRDNFLLVAGFAIFVILLLVLAIILVWQRSRRAEPTWPEEGAGGYYPEPPGADAGGAAFSEETQPKMDWDQEAPAWEDESRSTARTEFAAEEQGTPAAPDAFTPQAGAPSMPAPPAPPEPEPEEPGVRRSPESGTVILDHGPKMEHYAMLIDQSSRAKYDVDRPAISVGRSADNDIQLPSEKISRQHAVIKLEDGDFRIYDLGSANGTFVNGERVRAPVSLMDGDTVRVADVTLVFKLIT